MGDYVIITDSTTDLSKQLIDELGVIVLPLTYNIKGEEFDDSAVDSGKTIKAFYQKIREGHQSVTSQITMQRFIPTFKQQLDSGKDILYIGFSSGLSGTVGQAAISANELKDSYPDRKIFVVDTLAASLGEGMLVYYAAKMKDKGSSIEEVRDFVENNKLHLAHWFSVDDLNHLKRGGRVSPTVAFVGSILGIKPILHVDNEGHLIPKGKVRGRLTSLDELIKRAEKTIERPQEQTIFISHGDCLEDAEYVAQQAKEKLKVKDVIINYVGPVIGSHSGPGTIALFFFGKNRD